MLQVLLQGRPQGSATVRGRGRGRGRRLGAPVGSRAENAEANLHT